MTRIDPMRAWTKRALLALAALVVLAVAGVVVWWSLAGEAFLYRAIFPADARLLEGETVPETLDAEAFRRDLDFLAREMPRLHVDFDEAFGAARFQERVAELDAAAESLSPARRQLELVGLLAAGRTGTGHTMIIPLQRALGWRIYPLATYWFDDGLHVTAAGGPHGDLEGARVVTIGGRPTEEALRALAPYVPSDNEWSLRDNLPLLLATAEPLVALGLAAEDGTLTLGLEGGGRETAEIEPVRLASWTGLRFARRTQTPVEDAWSPADGRPRARPYTLRRGPDTATLYLRIDAMREDEAEPFAALAKRLVRMAEAGPVERFIVDLRSNGGGNNQLGRPVLEAIADHPVLDRRGVLYVLVGRRTFSAAGNLTGGLERRTRALFVGEPTGFAPDHYGDARPLLLPGSKLVARVASRAWRGDLPGAGRTALEPDLRVPFLARHHFENEDPTLPAILDDQRSAPAAVVRTAHGVPPGLAGSYLLSPHHRVRLFEEEGRARMEIDRLALFAATDLYGRGEMRSTDIAGVRLQVVEGAPPVLHWQGRSFALTPVDPRRRLPFERVSKGEIEAGVEAFRSAVGRRWLDSDFELALNWIGYEELEAGRTRQAVLLFTLCTELFPHSANTWDSLGDGLLQAGDPEAARAAFERSLALDPLFDHSRRRLEEIESATGAAAGLR